MSPYVSRFAPGSGRGCGEVVPALSQVRLDAAESDPASPRAPVEDAADHLTAVRKGADSVGRHRGEYAVVLPTGEDPPSGERRGSAGARRLPRGQVPADQLGHRLQGGEVAGTARRQIEKRTGKRVVTEETAGNRLKRRLIDE